MATQTTFTPQVLGETEKALNAILIRELDTAGLTEHQWITLQLTVAAGGRLADERLVARLAGALKRGTADAEARVHELVAAGLLAPGDDDTQVVLTEAGREAHGGIRRAVAEITDRLWGDLPQVDLDTTGRTLATILERANTEFSGAAAGGER
jgi:DNA-binding MarR family transcriptional regulator